MAVAVPLGQHWTFGQQIVQPIAPVPVATVNPSPIIPCALICAGLILLAIASVIILALIPVYTRRSGTDNVNCASDPFASAFNVNNGILPTGALSATNRGTLQSGLNTWLAGQAGFSRCSIKVRDGGIGSCPSSRPSLRKRETRKQLSNLIRYVRQTNNYCTSQQLSTTSVLDCHCSCTGGCLRRKVQQLKNLLLGVSIPLTFTDPTGIPVLITGLNVPTTPTTTKSTTTTTTTSTTTPLTTTVITSGAATSSAAAAATSAALPAATLSGLSG